MHQDKKNLRILRELMPQRSSKIQSRVAAIQSQGAPQSKHPGFFSLFRRSLQSYGTLQSRDRFLAVPLFSETNRLFGCQRRFGTRNGVAFWSLSTEWRRKEPGYYSE
jgi:hypothetical protein